MTLSLLGIIFVQLFWMNKAISIKEEQFDRQVNQALTRAARRIERNQNAYFMSNLFNMMPSFQIMLQNGGYPMSQNDSLIFEFGKFWNDNTKITDSDKNIKVQKKNSNGIETVRYSFDTIIVSGNTTQHIQTFSQVSTPNSTDKNIQFYNQSMQHKLNSVMQQMMLEYSMQNIPLEQRLSYSIIAPTLEYEFRNFNIPLKYEFAITDYKGNYYKNLKTANFKESKAVKAYSTSLFPNDILMHSDKLVLYFHDKRNYLINNMMWPFAGSVVFTLIILFTFYYTLKIIYNQKKVSEIKNDFINNMTHEFKTPIATISLAADSISNHSIISDPDKVSRFIDIIKEENRRMNRQVESVLKMALIDKKDFNLNMKEAAVHPFIENAVKNITLQVEQKGGKINLELKAGNDLLKIDETHFTNIVYNLLDNANKYSLNTPPEITVSTYNSGGYFYLAVADKGIGMDKETQDKIFEKFYRVPTGDVHTVKGFGLGLSYVKAIVMQFKGDITVKSQKNKGSVFTIKIPSC